MLQALTNFFLASLLLINTAPQLQPVRADMPVSGSTTVPAPTRLSTTSLGPKLTARAALVIDAASGAQLYHFNIDEPQPIASITKLMTALVVVDSRPHWDDPIVITKNDLSVDSVAQVYAGERVTTQDAFALMLIASANETAQALRQALEPETFVQRMQAKARSLKLYSATFVEPTGLEPANAASAVDVATLASIAFAVPEIQEQVKAPMYRFRPIDKKTWRQSVSTNQLLDSFLNEKQYTILGAKTGHTDEAGYALAMQVYAVGGPTLTVVILGAATDRDRWQEAKALVDWTMRSYQWPTP